MLKTIKNKTKRMLELEEELNKNIEEVLRVEYVDNNLSAMEISKKLNIAYVTVIDWLKLAGVYSRNLNIK